MKHVAIFIAFVAIFPFQVCGSILHVPAVYPTIQDGITAAFDGDTVLVADGVYTGDGNRDISFQGKAIAVESVNGPGFCIINCQGSETNPHQAFMFTNGEGNDSQLTGFTIKNSYQHSYMADGGAIYIDYAYPVISNCTFEANYTDDDGGAIYSIGAINLLIQNCVFNDNIAGSTQKGGAIHVEESDVEITGCRFSRNIAVSNYSSGGGAISGKSAWMVIDDCVFSSNQTQNSAVAGAVMSDNCEAIISNCLFENNRSVTHGGAIGVRGTAEIDGCVFIGNTAGQRGGAIYFLDEASGNVTGCTFENNVANLGGGICSSFSTPRIGGSEQEANTFMENVAGTGADIACLFIPETPLMAQWNHFIGYYNSDYYVSPSAAFDLSNCTYVREPITQDVYIDDDGSDTNDGLTWTTAFKTIQHAVQRIYATPGNPLSIHIAPGVYSPSTTGEIFPIPGINNVSIRGDHPSQTILNAESMAGVFFLHRDDNVTIENLKITGGYAARGGGIYCHKCSPIIQQCNIIGNTAGRYRKEGGGFYVHKASPYIRDCTVSMNRAHSGGGMYLYGSMAVVDNCRIDSNEATYSGGGLASNFNDESSQVFNCTISNNSSGDSGGGVACWSTEHSFINCLITDNTARYGAGIYGFCVLETLTFTNCTVVGNNATNQGGAYVGSKIASPMLTNCIVWNNQPEEMAGIPPGVTYSNIRGGFPGDGNIDSDPLFTTGWLGHYYLSHTASGHQEDSPCFDVGSDVAENICTTLLPEQTCMDELTTRMDLIGDSGQVDMGFHYSTETPFCDHTGDVNFDYEITSGDAQLGFMIALGGMTPTFLEQCAADCNGDDVVTAGDAQTIFLAALTLGACDDQY